MLFNSGAYLGPQTILDLGVRGEQMRRTRERRRCRVHRSKDQRASRYVSLQRRGLYFYPRQLRKQFLLGERVIRLDVLANCDDCERCR